jgi:myosin-7
MRSAGAPGSAQGANSDRALEAFKFETRSADEISALLKEYSPKVGADKRKDRETFVTEQEIVALNKDMDKARGALIKKRYVNMAAGKAAPGALSSMFENPLLKSSTNAASADAAPKEEMPANVDPAKYLPEWNARILTMPTPILTLFKEQPTLQHAATSMNALIQEYSLYEPPKQGKKDPKVVVAPDWQFIQRILQFCLDEPKMVDELYMQLMKFSSEHPKADSREVTRIWKLLAVTVGSMKPSIPEVVELVRCYFRRYAVMEVDTPVDKQRKEEVLYSKYCMKQFPRTLQTSDARKFLPSEDEIMFVSKLSPIYQKVYMPDGQYRALSFEPHNTVEDLTEVLKEKLKLTGILGYSIFAVKGSLERVVGVKDNLCDIMAKWDKSNKAAPNTDPKKAPRLVLKRRLFPNPLVPSQLDVEEEFALVQVIEDVLNGRYPAIQEDAILLVGLRAQVEYGDEKEEKNVNYRGLMEKYLPKSFHSDQVVTLIQREHSSFRGKSPVDCRRLYMARIRTWNLYGSTVFDVTQSYTSDYPKDCWLLVNHECVAISARQSKKALVTFKFADLGGFVPDESSIMILSKERDKKFVFQTPNAGQVASLITDYQALKQGKAAAN